MEVKHESIDELRLGKSLQFHDGLFLFPGFSVPAGIGFQPLAGGRHRARHTNAVDGI
jgi:hypothetical protein